MADERPMPERVHRASTLVDQLIIQALRSPEWDDPEWREWREIVLIKVTELRDHLDEAINRLDPPLQEAVTGPRCEVCGSELASVRSDARYCKDACRQLAYRRRHVAT
jgi:hypothetical protein